MLELLALFCLGAAYDCGAVMWVHFSERSQPLHSAFVSMMLGTAQILGLGAALSGGWHKGAMVVIGYGAGTALAVRLKHRIGRSSRSERSSGGASAVVIPFAPRPASGPRPPRPTST